MGLGGKDKSIKHDPDDDFDLHGSSSFDVSKKGSGASGFFGAVFNLTTTVVGAGIMALPATMKVLGLLTGTLVIILMGVISEVSLEMLVRFTVQLKATSYGEVVQNALGGPARILSEICIILNNAGILLVYLIIIGDVMAGSARHAGVLEQLFGNGIWTNRPIVIFVALLLFLAPLCALDKIDSLSPTSAASVVLAIMFVIVAAVVAFIKVVEGKVPTPRLFPNFSSEEAILELLVVIPIMSNAYVCHFNVQPIYNELENRWPHKMNKVGRLTTVVCVSIYCVTAIAGYLLFGKDTEADVLTNFDKSLGIRYSTALNYFIRIGYILHLILVFPVIHFSLRQTVNAVAFKDGLPLTESKKRCLVLTAVLLLLIYLASTMIPSIWTAFKFTGATTAVSLGFTFPALIALKLSRDGDGDGTSGVSSRERTLSWFMLVLAIIVCIAGVVGNIYSP